MSEESRGDKEGVDKDVEKDVLKSEVETEAEVKTKQKTVGVANSGRGLEETDADLDQLLDSSLNEFGKHVPPASLPLNLPSSNAPKLPFPANLLKEGVTQDDDNDPEMSEMEQVFGEEIAAQAEAQLNEAMAMLASENPELLKQFESLAQSLGIDEQGGMASPSGDPNVVGGATSGTDSLDAVIEETVRNIQESSQKMDKGDIGAMPPKLTEMMNNLQMEGGEGEENIMKVMENMMGTLLSKDVLYPSLLELCQQYPEWLRSHDDSLSPEDKARYSKQLDIMTAICREFEEKEEEPERQQRILQLMQQLQECGQPPDDLGGGPLPTPLLSPHLLTPQSPSEQCTVM